MASHSEQPAATGSPTRRQLREAARTASRPVADPAAPQAPRSAPRAGHPLARWGTRAGVLLTIAAVTVAVPLAQQPARSDDTFTDAEADATLPSTVEALTSIAPVVLPPASLVSTQATAVRAEVGVSRSEDREILPGCDGEASTGSANGQLPQSDLCYMWDGTQLRADAAEALAELNEMWVARFGTDLCLSSGYRTLAEQRAVKAQKGFLAAPAGRSNHGWGLAVDLCSSQTSGVQWEWLNENAPVFGWDNPDWARQGGSGPYERWHWEYTKGVLAQED